MLDQHRITDIKNVLFSLGELPKDDIVRLWELDEDDYAALKRAFDDEKLIEPGTRGRGGFVVRVRKRPLPADDEGAQPFALAHAWEEVAVARKCAVDALERRIPGKGSAAEFTHAVQFPPEFAGIPSPDAAPEFEYLEGRIELSTLADFQLEVQQAMRKVLEARAAKPAVDDPGQVVL